MALTCNIDTHGVRLRKIIGWTHLTLALIAALVAGWWGGLWLWLLAGALAAMGLFALFEARHKWCAIRAMGLKTRV